MATLQANKALALAPFVTVDLNPENGVRGPNITFSGANIHIVNGMNATQLVNGLGNLIIGYDESPITAPMSVALNPGDRGGSHNVVIGRWNRFYQIGFGNLISGELNWASGSGGFVAGLWNTIYGPDNTVLGGEGNVSNAFQTVVVGGQGNASTGNWTVTIGQQP